MKRAYAVHHPLREAWAGEQRPRVRPRADRLAVAGMRKHLPQRRDGRSHQGASVQTETVPHTHTKGHERVAQREYPEVASFRRSSAERAAGLLCPHHVPLVPYKRSPVRVNPEPKRLPVEDPRAVQLIPPGNKPERLLKLDAGRGGSVGQVAVRGWQVASLLCDDLASPTVLRRCPA